jgi:hypothetical protein
VVVAEFFEVAIGAAGLFASHPTDAAVDGLLLKVAAGSLDFGDDVAPGEHGRASALVETFDGFDDGVSAAWTWVLSGQHSTNC